MSEKSFLSPESIKQPFWFLKVKEVLEVLRSRPEGLGEQEVKARQKTFGLNSVQEFRPAGKIKIILNQLKNPLILILIVAGTVTAVLNHLVDTAVIFAAVLANTIFGFYQENKAETVLELLSTFIRTRARVRRDGGEHEVDAVSLVPGDIIRIRQGDRIPADARLLFTNDFEVDESVLTGESLPVSKYIEERPVATPLAERTSMVYGGTLVVAGFSDAVVCATGGMSEFGRIVSLVGRQKQEKTPLQRSISHFSSQVGIGILALAILLFGVGLSVGYPLFDMFLISVAVAVASVPEGLPIALTVILAIGVERIARRKGIVRKLLAAEALGSATLILTDKTGTLTQAKMELAEILPFESSSQEAKKNLLQSALLNLDLVIENPEEPADKWRMSGRALELALAKGAAKENILLPELLKRVSLQDRLPFSSEYKYSAALYHFDARVLHLAVFGAPEIILQYTDLSEEESAQILEEIDERAHSGARVLGVAEKQISGGVHTRMNNVSFNNLKFLGLITFRDPLRPGVGQAMQRIAEAGVRTVIVTGDHKGTAEAVARELGIVDGKGVVLSGEDLKLLSAEELKARAHEVRVYARVTPEQKLKLSKMYQEQGEVVAVTGDGVNDAPALKGADIGVAVGSGTDVAKGAADLIILDDNFETIVAAIEEGRRILQNIRKVVVYLLSSVFDELFLIGGALLFAVPLPLSALQILFVNFFSDSFPAIAFAFEDGADHLKKSSSPAKKGIFDPVVRFLILGIGIGTSILLFALYYILLKAGFASEVVRSFIFASFATYTLLLAFSVRNLEKSIFDYNPFSNRYLLFGSGIGIVFTLAVIYLPFLQGVFGTVSLPLLWLIAVFGIGIFNIAAIEFGKWLFRR